MGDHTLHRTVAVAGATGNAGLEIVRALLARGVAVRALVRNPAKLAGLEGPLEIRRVDLTDPAAIRGCLDGVDTVVSALGKTLQRGRPKRRVVDVEANLALLVEAQRAGVAKFGFISVAMARPDHPIAMLRMKGEVEQAIRASGLQYVIVQPSGYFSDLWQVFEMARKGTLWVFGDGKMRFNPIHPRDLAEFTVDRLLDERCDQGLFPVGGREIFDSPGLAALCEDVLGRGVRVRHIPLSLALALVTALRPFHEDTWQLADFFIGSIAHVKRELGDDASQPSVGTRRLGDYFRARQLAEAAGDPRTPASRQAVESRI